MDPMTRALATFRFLERRAARPLLPGGWPTDDAAVRHAAKVLRGKA